jgi:hypothetical protein
MKRVSLLKSTKSIRDLHDLIGPGIFMEIFMGEKCVIFNALYLTRAISILPFPFCTGSPLLLKISMTGYCPLRH